MERPSIAIYYLSPFCKKNCLRRREKENEKLCQERKKRITKYSTVTTELMTTSEKELPNYNDHHFKAEVLNFVNYWFLNHQQTMVTFLGRKGGRCTQNSLYI